MCVGNVCKGDTEWSVLFVVTDILESGMWPNNFGNLLC